MIVLKLRRAVISLKEGGFKCKPQFYQILFTKFRPSWFLHLFLVCTFGTFSIVTQAGIVSSLEKSGEGEEIYSRLFPLYESFKHYTGNLNVQNKIGKTFY
jgi:hypothetical protein